MAETAMDVLKKEKAALAKRLALIERGERLAADLAELVAEDAEVAGLVLSTLPQQPRPAEGRKR